MKKYLSLSLALILSFTMVIPTFASTTVVQNPKVLYTNNNTPITFENEVLNVDGTTFFPLRELLNNLGVKDEHILWNEETKTVTFSKDNYTSSFTVGSKNYKRNDSTISMPVEPFIADGKTYLPIRYVGNSIGYRVGYDETLKQILVTDVNYNHDIPYRLEDLPQLQPVDRDDTIAVMNTNQGNIVVRLFPEYAPLAVENFVTLANEGYYDGVTFHRTINDFVIQGGDPTATGMGGESIYGKDFDNEITPMLHHFPGALAMANAGPNTNGSQFYIVESDSLSISEEETLNEFKNNPYEMPLAGIFAEQLYSPATVDAYIANGGLPALDYGYTVFGQVIDQESFNTVSKIAEVKTDKNDKPLEDVIINSIDVMTYADYLAK